MKNLRQLFLLITLAYVVWAGLFIHNTSFIIDGTRYYCLFDDAMISMRYAENWVNGKGVVWNQGEYVEGYTNPLQVVLMAGCLLIAPKIQAVLLVQLLGIAMVVCSAWFAGKIFENIRGSSQGVWIVWLATYLLYPLSYWALLGMETGLVTALLMAGTAMATNPVKKPNPWVLGLLLSLLYLARPDAVLYGFIILTYLALPSVTSRKFPTAISKSLVVLGATVIAHLAWRYSYYGQLKPNTAVLKLGGWDFMDRIGNGLAYMEIFSIVIVPFLLLSLLSLLLSPTKPKMLLGGLVTVAWSYQIYTGGDAWLYWRMLMPSVLLMAILTAEISLDLSTNRVPSKRRSILNAVPLMAFALLVFNRPMLKEQLLVEEAHSVRSNEENTRYALAVRAVSTESASVGVFWAGAIPFFAERRGIDFLGKCDPVIAKMPIQKHAAVVVAPPMKTLPGHNKYDMKHSLYELQPTFIQRIALCDEEVSKWVKSNYIQNPVMGTDLIIRKNSPEVRWQ